MTLTGFPFALEPAQKHHLLTLEEHEGLCCLLDRAQHYGGTGDIVFLCMSTCSLLVRFAPQPNGIWGVTGYAFQKVQEPWVWIYLPSLLGTVLNPPCGKLSFSVETAGAADGWLERHAPALRQGAQQFARDSARQMHAYSIGFTHLDPALYADSGIQWYPLTPAHDAQEHTVTLPKPAQTEPDALSQENTAFEQPDELHIVPPRILPRIFKTWRVRCGKEKYKLGTVEPISDWYDFADRIYSVVSQN